MGFSAELSRKRPDGLRLSVGDRGMLTVCRALQEMGFPGFQIQLLAGLSGRLWVPALQAAISRFADLFPVVASRLVEPADGSPPYWKYHPEKAGLLRETCLSSADPEAVLEQAGQLLSTPSDLTRRGPLCFHLFHGPDGRDVLLMQFDHVLMDNNAGLLILKEINRLAQPEAIALGKNTADEQDWGRRHLRRLPWPRRKTASSQSLKLWTGLLGGGVAMLGRPAPARPGPGQLRLASLSLSADQTQAVQARLVKECGFPSLSMALLASVFRGIAQLSPQRFAGSFNLVAALGLDLGLRAKQGLLCQNAASLLPLRVSSDDLPDRTALASLLSQRFRQLLDEEKEIGALQTISLFSRRSEQAQRAIELLFRLGFSLWYGYFGALDLPGGTFCQVPLEKLVFFGPSWSPMGLTLLGNLFRGQLTLQATYVPQSVPESLAREFLHWVAADLVGPSG